MRLIKQFNKGEGGQILTPVLIVLVMGSLMIVPLLNFMGTGLNAVRTQHEHTDRVYAADAGIQYGIWKIISDTDLQSTSSSKVYPAITVNSKSTVVKVEYWSVLDGIIGDRQGPHADWVDVTTTGTPSSGGVYVIDINFAGSGNKKIQEIGVWMPNGFNYVSHSAALYPGNITTGEPNVTAINGGVSIEWDGLSYSLIDHPHCTQTFKFTPSDKTPKGDCGWVKSQSNDIGYSYDNNIYSYAVTSTATDSSSGKYDTIVAHVSNDVGGTAGTGILTYEINPSGVAPLIPLRIETGTLFDGEVGLAYSQPESALGGTTPYTWSIASGSLPAGLSLNASTGTISGTPTTAGTSNFTVRVTDGASPTPATTTKALSITTAAHVAISTTSLPNGKVGVAYNQTMAASGGTTPYTWSITAGSLPAGLSLGAGTGVITGTPSHKGTYNFTVQVTDSVGGTATQALSITIS